VCGATAIVEIAAIKERVTSDAYIICLITEFTHHLPYLIHVHTTPNPFSLKLTDVQWWESHEKLFPLTRREAGDILSWVVVQMVENSD
jgi:hypothetical protein